ncbi:ATP-binding protein [Bailinhaonella thermotolerans]|uniref:ATP-binding protein n=1 Tax=Bailinhaonella thermotolerans TaxID=1070861 RepID=A0A3A4B159_9ACTN|nr:ATP-binding protein [Bailinhaonella thermotolerans]RJL34569.1 ATP-binding protein [Bailinhaonella thermotolerans]
MASSTAVQRTLPPQSSSVRAARDVTRSTLSEWGLESLSDDAVLVVSELVTNALRYGLFPTFDRPITLMLARRGTEVLCAVTDPSQDLPVVRSPDYCQENGRGLHVVEIYSRRWGCDILDTGGKAVWALFDATA